MRVWSFPCIVVAGTPHERPGSYDLSQPSVLIISDESEFSSTIVARWQTERSVPAFLMTTTAGWNESEMAGCDLVIVAGVKDLVAPVFKAVDESGKPVILLATASLELQRVHNQHARFMLVREHEGWVEVVVALAAETLRRLEANQRTRRAEQALAQAEGHAMLGRYMLDMRHSMNNALTSVLGNAELMLLEPGAFSAEVRDQLATIHTMALRIHDIVQRFSSMESEMKLAAKSHTEMKAPTARLAAVR
jgi:signal transduction histidine kinase